MAVLNRLSVRVADENDEAEIFRLIARAEYVHLHADWTISADYWQQSGSMLAERNHDLIGFIAATQDPPPVAWIRSLAINMSEPHYALRLLLPPVRERLRAAGAQTIALLAASNWTSVELPRIGFAVTDTIEEMIKYDVAVPDMSLEHISIRRVESADFPSLAQLDQQAFHSPLWWQSARQLQRAQPETISYSVAEQNGVILGYQMSVKSSSRQAHLVRLVIGHAYHGQGIGSALLAAALNDFARLGLTKVSVNTQINNLASHRLYKRFGFEAIGKQYNVWTQPL